MPDFVCGACGKPKGDTDYRCKCGRATKLTNEFLVAAEAVLKLGDDVIVLTDQELLFGIDEKLPESQQVDKSTFEAWKAFTVQDAESANWRRFRGLIKRALIREKSALYQKYVKTIKLRSAGLGSSNASLTVGTSSEKLNRM